MHKEKVKFDLLVDPDDPSTLLIVPVDGEVQDGSIYTVNINNLPFEDGSTYSNKETFITTPTEYYLVPIDDVKELIKGLNLDDASILSHIKDASKTAIYWSKYKVKNKNDIPTFTMENIVEDYYPFYMFIKYHATAEALKEFYIGALANPMKWKDTLSDLSREEEWDLDGIKDLLDSFDREAEEWLQILVTITADPKWALRGKYCYTAFYTSSNPYHRIQWGQPPHSNGFNRGY